MNELLGWLHELSIKDLAAFWGAILSTVTALGLYLSSRPAIILTPENHFEQKYKLKCTIINSYERAPLQITKCYLLGFEKKEITITRKVENPPHTNGIRDALVTAMNIVTESNAWTERKRSNFFFYVYPKSQDTFFISNINRKTNCLALFVWHRHGIRVLPRIPLFLWVSGKRAEQIHSGRPDYLKKTEDE
jgi:hypothetical protein